MFPLINSNHAKYFFFLRKHFMKKKLVLTQKNVLNINKPSKVLLKFNKDESLQVNWMLLKVLQNYSVSNEKQKISQEAVQFTKTSSLIKFTPIYLSLTKEFTLLKWEKKRQFFFFFTEILASLEQTSLGLLKHIALNFDKKDLYLKEKSEINIYYNYLTFLFSGKNAKISLGRTDSILNSLLLKNINNLLLLNVYTLISLKLFNFSHINIKNFKIKDNILNLYSFWNLSQNSWESMGLPPVISQNTYLKEFLIKDFHLKKSKIISLIKRRTTALPNYSLRTFNNLLKEDSLSLNIVKYSWKHASTLENTASFDSIAKLSRLYNKNYNTQKISFQILYLITRIEDKIITYKATQSNEKFIFKLTELRNLLLYLVNEKKERKLQNSAVLSTKNVIMRIRTKSWKVKLLTFLKDVLLKKDISKHTNFYTFINLLFTRLSLGRKAIKSKELPSGERQVSIKNFIFSKQVLPQSKNFRSNIFTAQKKTLYGVNVKPWRNKAVNIQRNWINSKVVLSEKHLTFTQKKAILSSWINRPVDLFFINALALTKFAFKNERGHSPNNNPNVFLNVLDRDFINKYKYIGIYIKDLVRVAFIAVFFKNPSFLAKFMAFQLAKLPRNRKETNFVRFLIKVIKTFAAERKEILGVRIRFKGRVNRWRRTKFILGNRGTLPLQTISERIEQGTAQAVNKKGAVGIRIWLRYKQSFSYVLKDHILKYINYSKILKMRKIRKNLLLK